MGWTYCGECAVKKSEAGMFVNPARWGGQDPWHVLAVGGKTEPALTDRDTIEHALAVLDRETAAVVFRGDKMCAGDAALRQWLAACDSPENAAKLFNHVEMYPYALYYNSIYTQRCMLAWYKNLAGRESQKVHDAVNQITIAVDRLESSRREVDKLGKKKATEKYAAACREHIEFLLQYRRDLRGWLRDICAT